jgi:hypothetical protein
MDFGITQVAARQPHHRFAFQLTPATFSILAPQSPPVSDAEIDCDGFDFRDFPGQLKIHRNTLFPSLTRRLCRENVILQNPKLEKFDGETITTITRFHNLFAAQAQRCCG